MTAQPLVLVIDDDAGVRSSVERFIRRLDFEVMTFPDGADALKALDSVHPDVALVDLQMPEVGGLDVLRALRARAPECQVILITAQPTIDSAIEAVKLGALDYLPKPFPSDRVRQLLTAVREDFDRRRELLAAEGDWAARYGFCGMIGRSPVMQQLFDTIKRLAPHVRSALVTGETGTGKELVARAFHDLGDRKARRFVPYNCSAIVETLFESEFFGHTRGAFTGAGEAKPGLFEVANGGTLFLDEIAELPLALQAKLLRVVEYGEVQRVGATESRRVDVCLIAATNRRLPDEVRAGRFREDLYYRLNVVEISLPSLRERREDISYLTAAFVKEFAKRFHKPIIGVSPAAERALQAAPWPGNVRELRHALERACMLAESRLLGERDVFAALGSSPAAASLTPAAAPKPANRPVERVPALDRDRLIEVLEQAGGNRSAAARLLGVSRRALYRRLDALGLR